MTDEELDYSEIPPLTDEFFARAKLVLPNAVELDPDIVAWFKQHGRDYPTRINQILREYIALQEH
ncbi:MAG: BrnA antitoxin family protein [Chloroflexales bacterium]|nr:BrnA antitoxin family protein [Chloroflexales bacterium]